MARGITLVREEESLAPVINRGDNFRIRISATGADLMPAEIFMVLENTLDAKTGTISYDFCYVASPEDLAYYPTDAPRDTDSPPYYRLAAIDVIVASRKLALEMWNDVHERVCELVAALNRKDQLVVAETVRCGDPEEPTSTSVSQSISV